MDKPLNYSGLRTTIELEKQFKAKLSSSVSTGGYVRRFVATKGKKSIEGEYHYGTGTYDTRTLPIPKLGPIIGSEPIKKQKKAATASAKKPAKTAKVKAMRAKPAAKIKKAKK